MGSLFKNLADLRLKLLRFGFTSAVKALRLRISGVASDILKFYLNLRLVSAAITSEILTVAS